MSKRREILRHLAAGWTGSTWSVSASPRAAEAIEALRRMDAGAYGFCADCKKRIPQARLEVKPEATRCVECEGQRERRSVAWKERSQLWCQILGEIDYAI
jgi:hypothetical protein